MKTKTLFLLLASLMLSVYSCNSDPCDDGFTQVEENGATFCLPDYVVGIEKLTEYGNRFYHDEYEIIEYKNGIWTNEFGKNITDILIID